MAQALRSGELEAIEDFRADLRVIRGGHVSSGGERAVIGLVRAFPDLACQPRQPRQDKDPRGRRDLQRRPARYGDSSKGLQRHPSNRAHRRAGALVAAVSIVLVALALPVKVLAGTPPVATGAYQSSTSSLPSVMIAGQGSVYIVQPGDTLGSIAQRLDPSNPRLAFSNLEDQIGSTVVVPGEHIELPSSGPVR